MVSKIFNAMLSSEFLIMPPGAAGPNFMILWPNRKSFK